MARALYKRTEIKKAHLKWDCSQENTEKGIRFYIDIAYSTFIVKARALYKGTKIKGSPSEMEL